MGDPFCDEIWSRLWIGLAILHNYVSAGPGSNPLLERRAMSYFSSYHWIAPRNPRSF
jgi:hypothetical protein